MPARILTVDGAERIEPTLDDVLDAVSAFVESPAHGPIALTVVVDAVGVGPGTGVSRTLRAEHAADALVVSTPPDGTRGLRIAARLDGSAVTVDELVWIFSAFYPEGKRLAQYQWRPPGITE